MNENVSAQEAGPLQIIILLLTAIIIIIPFWRIFSKAGYSGWFSLLMVLPILNLIMLYFLAFAKWPILRESRQMTDSTPPAPTSHI